ncbi:uncharacterized protein BDZ99DRAFT_501991 [Mytilinidion resinicola]|uniref:Uncharacterized protein n=1 Tax=Mytilinidion resinicola TaxID=574789 RepID=A0A6A6Y988_9PEZI|nr:uncharacterized protein BDZ99DRAFT_501991 [Mytilinidion resinicola]KAF2805113.1 hypothetical protein BDZ99DRAFT_501991 [Mytilinidion resinicola]
MSRKSNSTFISIHPIPGMAKIKSLLLKLRPKSEATPVAVVPPFSHFLHLPIELRLKIYDFVLNDLIVQPQRPLNAGDSRLNARPVIRVNLSEFHMPRHRAHVRECVEHITELRAPTPKLTSILLLNHQIHDEVTDQLHSTYLFVFQFPEPQHVRRWIEGISDRARRQIRHLELQFILEWDSMRHLRYETACHTMQQLLPNLRTVRNSVTLTEPRKWNTDGTAFLNGKVFTARVDEEYVDRLMRIAAAFQDSDVLVEHPVRSQLCHNVDCIRLRTERQWRVHFPLCVLELPLGSSLRDEILTSCNTRIHNVQWPVD